MSTARLHPALAIAALAVSTLVLSVAYVWARHGVLHWITDIGAHDHVFTLNLAVRITLVVLFGVIVRWLANVTTLGGWTACGIGTMAVAFPVVLAGLIIAGKAPHLMSIDAAGEVPYEVLAVTYIMNLIGGAAYGALGWLFLIRLMRE